MQYFRIALFSILIQGICLAQGTIDLKLHSDLASNPDRTFDVLVFLNQRADLEQLSAEIYSNQIPVVERPSHVIQHLKSAAEFSQKSLINMVDAWNNTHQNEQAVIKTRFFIINAIRIMAPAEFIGQLAYSPHVEYIMSSSKYKVHGILPVRMMDDNSRSVGGIEPGLELIGAPFMWNLGYTGLNRKLYTVDTGVWPIHPALADNWAGNYLPVDQVWYGFDSELPGDKPNAHGTHVTGTVLGMDPSTSDTIGVAFNAHFIASDPIVQDAADIKPLPVILESFQFALNPDGNDTTSDDVPDVICNSWGIGDSIAAGLCTAPFITDLYAALDLAGIAVEHSAGNEGPDEGSISLPQYVTLDSLTIFTVGALDASSSNNTIASFSSRGPTSCEVQESWRIKPEVSAPGVNVRSSVQFDQYALYSGTSMAGPHVAGAVLLLKEAFPFLSGREILNALYQSAIDLGEEGEDNTYGKGLINLENAYNFLSLTHEPVPPNTSEIDIEILSFLINDVSCSGIQPIDVVLKNLGSQPIVGGGVISFWIDGDLQSSVPFQQEIGPSQELSINLGDYDILPGNRELYAKVQLNTSQVERISINNNRTKYTTAVVARDLPFGEGFEFNGLEGNDIFIENPDFNTTWDTVTTEGLSNSSYSSRMRFFGYSRRNQSDDILLPSLIIPNERDSLIIKFDYAYRFRSNSFADSLLVEWSDNCGESWNSVFYKGGEGLSTIDTLWTLFVPFSSTHWESFKINISDDFEGERLLVRFRAINNSGSILYVDNIGIYTDEDPTTSLQVKAVEFKLFPNPARENITLSFEKEFLGAHLYIIDAMGRIVFSDITGVKNEEHIISVKHLNQGVYFIQVIGQGVTSTKRFIVQ